MNTPFYHREVPPVVRVAQVIGITSAAALCGQLTALTVFGVPAILQADAVTLAKQYSTLHGRIVPFFPALAAGTGGILAYLAQVSRPEKPEKFRLYAGAAVAVFSLIPFNIFALKPTVDEINKRAESKVEMATAKESTHQLVDRWGTLNLVNAGLAGISALLAAWAAMVDVEVMPLEAVRLTAGADRMS